MVLLKEVSDGIWGVTLGPNKTTEVITERPFRLTMAALEIDDGNQSTTTSSNVVTRVTVKSSTADKGPVADLILCNLHFPSCLQQPLDLEFYDGQTITFGAKGPYRVHLTGYLLQSEPHEMCEEGCTHEHEHDHVHHDDTNKPLFNLMGGDDDESDSSDDDDVDDSDDESSSDDRGELNDDEDQDLEGDYEDGYVEGEDQLSNDSSSSSESDSEEKHHVTFASDKGKKRPRAEANGHHNKQEPLKKKTKKNSNIKEEQLSNSDTAPHLPTTSSKNNGAAEMTSKKAKKLAKKAATASASSASTAANESHATSTMDEKKSTEKTNSLDALDIRIGTGPEAKLGKTMAVYYTGRLKSNNSTFDSCVKGKPFRFRLGAGEVIRGWDQGVKGMRVGGKRRLTIPPSLAYGSQKLPDIPAHSTLVFDIELKNVF